MAQKHAEFIIICGSYNFPLLTDILCLNVIFILNIWFRVLFFVPPPTGHVGVPLPCNFVKLVDVEDMNYFASNGEGEVGLLQFSQ